MTPVSRTYNARYDMPVDDWKKIEAVYQQLPEFRGYDESGCPTWFGVEGQGKYLGASVEPSGLLVEGVLDEEEWVSWDAAFRSYASRALGIEIRDAEE